MNDALEELVAKIINVDGTWQYDDTNYTSLPKGKGLLVEGQEWYSFASEYLEIAEIAVLDTNNTYRKVNPIDDDDFPDQTWEQYFGVDASGNPVKGFPRYYDIMGDSIRLGPAPTSSAVTLTNGLRVTFKRTASLFTATSATTANTTEPGLPSSFHVLLAYKAALPYCANYKPERVSWLMATIDKLEKDLVKFFSRRELDKRKVMSGSSLTFR